MSNRLKKTLLVAAYPAFLAIVSAVYLHARRGVWVAYPGTEISILILIGSTGHAWWWYGDSTKAVALREKAAAKKAARRAGGSA